MTDLQQLTLGRIDNQLRKIGVQHVGITCSNGVWLARVVYDGGHTHAEASSPMIALVKVLELGCNKPAWTLEEVLADKRAAEDRTTTEELDAVTRKRLGDVLVAAAKDLHGIGQDPK